MSFGDEVLVELDDRRRVYLSKVGRSTDTRDLVPTHRDGTMVFTPATVVPTHILRLLERPDILAAMRHADEHPEVLVRRSCATSPTSTGRTGVEPGGDHPALDGAGKM